MNQAALGFRAHSGWTSLVAIALEDGLPMVLLRQRLHLVRNFTYEFRQPYHTAEKSPRAEECKARRADCVAFACQSICAIKVDLRSNTRNRLSKGPFLFMFRSGAHRSPRARHPNQYKVCILGAEIDDPNRQ